MSDPEKIIAVDVDEVKFPFVAQFASWHNTVYGTSVREADFTSYMFEEPLGVDTATVVERVYQFHEVDDLHVPPIDGAEEGLSALSGTYHLHSLTARHPRFREHTRRWIGARSLPIDEVHTIGHPVTMKEQYKSKAETCQSIGAIALIDDSPHHVAECLDIGIDAVLFGDYPWNQDAPKSMKRCADWSAVVRHFRVEG